jgi:hypothetical protein
MPTAFALIAVTSNFTGAQAGTTVGDGDAAALAAAAALSAAAASSTVGTCTQAAPLYSEL